MVRRDPCVRLPPFVTQKKARVAALSSPVRPDMLAAGIERLQKAGWDIVEDESVYDRDWLTAGGDSVRIAALQRWLQAAEPLLINARGGYGCNRLLAGLKAANGFASCGWLTGSSDTTAVQMWLWEMAGTGSLYGPMVSAGLARQPDERTVDRLDLIATGGGQEILFAHQGQMICPGVVTAGPALGGCLSMLASLAGTGYLPSGQGCLLFVEDIGEAPYRLERYLWQLVHSGWMEGARGIVLGTFPGCDPKPGSGYSLEDLFARFLAPLRIPVWYGYPFGHTLDGDPCDTIILGARYELTGSGPVLSPLEYR